MKAADITNNDPVVLDHLGDVYHALHEPDKALEAWKKVILSPEEKEEGLQERVEKKIRELELQEKNR